MKRILALVLGLALVVTFDRAATAQDVATQLVGVWKAVDISRKEIESGKIDKPYGEKPVAYFIFTKGGYFSWTFVAENRQKPAGAAVTDAERVELFKTMSFGTGTYKVEANKLALRYDSSWHHAWVGIERVSDVPAISGTRMVNTSSVFKHPVSGVNAITIQTFERVD